MKTRCCVTCGKQITKRTFSIPVNKTFCSLRCAAPSVATNDDILSFIIQYKVKNDGNSPTLQEIANGLGYKSKSPVLNKLQQLERAGQIERQPNRSYIIVVGGYWQPPVQAASNPPA